MKKGIFITIFIILVIFAFSKYSFAQTAEELRDQIVNTNSEIDKIDKEIKILSNQITATGKEKNTLASAIKELTLTRNKLVKEKEGIEKKIKATGLVINILSNDIEDKQTSINISKSSLSSMFKNLNQSDNTLLVERFLSLDSFTDFSREYNNILSLNQKIKDKIREISGKKEELINTKIEKEDEQQNLTILKDNLIQKEKVVLTTQKEKDALLVATKNKEIEYQKMLEAQKKKKETFEKSLEEYEAKLKFILNPKILPKEGSGVLSWPLNQILVTSQYGARWGRFHYGIDFRASVGTAVFAMEDGVVGGTGDTDISCPKASFGKWVFIKYNNGLSSTYGHLSSISSKSGQKVKKGDIVGYSGNTGSSTGPHLHVAVYASTGVKVDTVPSKSCGGKVFTQPIAALTAYLNPASYLPKITSSMIKK
jgi:murein DD-endopeptidase MepM/ murein hydrolase activator NlpD